MAEQPWTQQTLIEISNAYWRTCILHAAVKLDLFTQLGDREGTAAELAGKIKADRDALERLLNALVAMGLLVKGGERFACAPNITNFLSRRSPGYLGHIILHHHHLVETWLHLDKAVASGRPIEESSFSEEEWQENFLLGMYDLAMILAPRTVGKIDLRGRSRLLDLGGGPGTWAIHFCEANPGLEAVVFDLPATRPFAEEALARFGLEERISFAAGDFLKDDIGGRYDVAWLSHILHGEGPEEVKTILEKTRSALEPGGLLLVHEFILDDDLAGPLFPALFSLNMLLNTPAGRSYSERQLFDLLRATGFREPRRLALDMPGESSVIAAAA